MTDELKEGEFIPLHAPELLPATTKEQKESNWRAMTAYVDNVGDRLGLPVDEGIKESVVALNVFGINTSGSCEGHLDRGIAAPWIDVQAKKTREGEALKQQADALFENAETREKEGAPPEELDQIYKEYHRLRKEIKRPDLEEVKKLMQQLIDFYADRKVPFDTQLTIAQGRLQSQGAILQEIADLSTKEQQLHAFQEEMRAFTIFLKDKYFAPAE